MLAVRRHLQVPRMLRPNQFEVNEAWIVFRLNNAPIRIEHEGSFNCIALMDAASCFIRKRPAKTVLTQAGLISSMQMSSSSDFLTALSSRVISSTSVSLSRRTSIA